MPQSQIDNWKKDIEQITNDFIAAFGNIDNNTLNTKPNAGTWSIAQVLEHVIKTNESYFAPIKDIYEGKYKVPVFGKIGFLNDLFGSMLLKAVQPEAKMKLKTVPRWEPSVSNISEGIVQRFQQHQKELSRVIEISADLVERKALIASPANANVVYKLGKAFEILIAHEKRHYQQAKNILAAIQKK